MENSERTCSPPTMNMIRALRPGDRMMYAGPNSQDGRYISDLCERDETYVMTQGKIEGGSVYWLNKISIEAARNLEALAWSCPLPEAFPKNPKRNRMDG